MVDTNTWLAIGLMGFAVIGAITVMFVKLRPRKPGKSEKIKID